MISTVINKTVPMTSEEFIGLEQQIREHANFVFVKALSEVKSIYFDKLKYNESAVSIFWLFNKRSVLNNSQVGDLTSNNLWKFHYDIFPRTEFDDENLNQEKLEKEFIDKLGQALALSLNSSIPESLKDKVLSYQVKNNYLNIKLTGSAKEFVDKKINDMKPKPVHEQIAMQPVATFYSCFPEKFSIPRQGAILSKTRGKIVFDTKVVDLSCIEGIEEYEYFWVIYIFHLHTGFKGTKVSPPKKDKNTDKNMANHAKLGIFATRTPHRVNPIGLTLVKLERVIDGELHVSGIDMVNGTPIIDIKPYHHLESIGINKYPDWILNADKDTDTQRNKVQFSTQSLDQLAKYVNNQMLEFYDDYNEIYELIKELLEIDPHSKFTKKKSDKLIYAFYIDKLNVIYEFDAANKEVQILSIDYVEEYKKLRTKEWLNDYKKQEDIQKIEEGLAEPQK